MSKRNNETPASTRLCSEDIALIVDELEARLRSAPPASREVDDCSLQQRMEIRELVRRGPEFRKQYFQELARQQKAARKGPVKQASRGGR